MAQFRYLRTIIDEEPVGVLESRSKSWPQLVGWETKTTREDIETQAASYVAELQGKCIMTFGARPQPPQGTPPPETNPDISGNLAWAQEVAADSIEAQEAQEAQAEVAEYSGNLGNLGSLGSLGHPALCRRPCVRLAKGMCKTGDACDYCHYGHPRYVPPDKRQRCELNDMETAEFLAVLLPHIRRSVEASQIQATHIIGMLEDEIGPTKAPSLDRALRRTLRRMPLSALLGLIMARDGFRPLLEEEIEVMRRRLG